MFTAVVIEIGARGIGNACLSPAGFATGSYTTITCRLSRVISRNDGSLAARGQRYLRHQIDGQRKAERYHYALLYRRITQTRPPRRISHRYLGLPVI